MPVTRGLLGWAAPRLALALGTALALSCGTGGRRQTATYDRAQLEAALAKENAGLVIGEFALSPDAVVDGDTIKVEGLDASLRLLVIDTEETFKSEKDLRAYESLGFSGYLEKKARGTERPIKCATPLGMDAKHFAEDFFRGVTTIRLERDHPKELRGHYDRVLAYVFVDRGGEWINYNIESVRVGMSPYFSKYGYSRRFHEEFVAAQEEARAAKRGIWDPALEHYDDYDVRLEWWDARGDFLRRFDKDAEGRSDLIALTHWDSLDRLAASEGQEIELLAGVGDIKPGSGQKPTRVNLSRRMFSGFPLIFFDDEVVARSQIKEAQGEFVRVRGTVTSYTYKSKRRRRKNREGGERQLQIVVRAPQQIVISDTAPTGPVGPRTPAGVVGDTDASLPPPSLPPPSPPPVETPPVETPPVETPSVETPPVETPLPGPAPAEPARGHTETPAEPEPPGAVPPPPPPPA